MPGIARGTHRFHTPRPQPGAVTVRTRHAPLATQPFRPLPEPTGAAPYHLQLEVVLAAEAMTVIVLAGHVHNYQRFTRSTGTGQVPYIVAGAGGYWHLHSMQKLAGGPIPTPYPLPTPDADVTLESYVDDDHGFLRLDIMADTLSGQYLTVPQPQEHWREPSQRTDAFTYRWRQHRLERVLG